MAYLTITELRDIIGERRLLLLADDGDGALGTEEVGRINEALEDASSELDSYLGVRYSVPLQTAQVTRTMRRHVANAAVYHVADTCATVTKDIQRRYDAACKWAQDVSCGKAKLGNTEQTPDHRTAAASTENTSRRRVTQHPPNTLTLKRMEGLG